MAGSHHQLVLSEGMTSGETKFNAGKQNGAGFASVVEALKSWGCTSFSKGAA